MLANEHSERQVIP